MICFLGVKVCEPMVTSRYTLLLFWKIVGSIVFVPLPPRLTLNIPLDGVTLIVLVVGKVPEAVYKAVPPVRASYKTNFIDKVDDAGEPLTNTLPW